MANRTSRLGLLQLGAATLGAAGGDTGRTPQTLSVKANILNTVNRELTVKASIHKVTSRTISARTRIRPAKSIEIRANICALNQISDSYDRADNTSSLGSTDTDQLYQYTSGRLYGILGNKAYVSGGDPTGIAFIESGKSDGITITADIRFSTVGAFNGLFWRLKVSESDQWIAFLIISGTSRLQIRRIVAGSTTIVYEANTITSFVGGDVAELKIVLNGSQQEIYVGGNLETTINDSANIDNTEIGFFIGDTGVGTIDNLLVLIPGLKCAKNLLVKASITDIGTKTKTISAKANIKNTITRTLSIKANLTPIVKRTIRMRARIIGKTTRTIGMKANIDARVERTISIKAKIERPKNTISARARILVIREETISALAAITPQELRRISARASIEKREEKTISILAKIFVPTDLSIQAYIRGAISSTLEVEFNVKEPITGILPVFFDATQGVTVYKTLSARARILKPISSILSVSFTANYIMPESECVVRPTQRIQARIARTFSMRAKIRK